jgi:hypothetical protein
MRITDLWQAPFHVLLRLQRGSRSGAVFGMGTLTMCLYVAVACAVSLRGGVPPPLPDWDSPAGILALYAACTLPNAWLATRTRLQADYRLRFERLGPGARRSIVAAVVVAGFLVIFSAWILAGEAGKRARQGRSSPGHAGPVRAFSARRA